MSCYINLKIFRETVKLVLFLEKIMTLSKTLPAFKAMPNETNKAFGITVTDMQEFSKYLL